MLVIKREDQTVDISTQIDADIILNTNDSGAFRVDYVRDGLPFYVGDTWWDLFHLYIAWREQCLSLTDSKTLKGD